MNYLIKIIMLLMSFNIWSQDMPPASEEVVMVDLVTQKQILERVDTLKDKDFKDFISELSAINADVEKFILSEQQACSKLHATQEIKNNKLEKEKKRPLTKKEKMYCKLLIVNFQIKLNQKIHELRIEKLKQIHLAQLEQVEKEHNTKIVELEKIANKLK